MKDVVDGATPPTLLDQMKALDMLAAAAHGLAGTDLRSLRGLLLKRAESGIMNETLDALHLGITGMDALAKCREELDRISRKFEGKL